MKRMMPEHAHQFVDRVVVLVRGPSSTSDRERRAAGEPLPEAVWERWLEESVRTGGRVPSEEVATQSILYRCTATTWDRSDLLH